MKLEKLPALVLQPFTMCGQTFLCTPVPFRPELGLYAISEAEFMVRYQELSTNCIPVRVRLFKYKGYTFLTVANSFGGQKHRV